MSIPVDGERMPDKYFYKIPKYPVWMECIKVWILFAVPGFVLLYGSYDQGGGYGEFWFPLVLLIMPIFSTIIRRKIRFLILFILLHAAMCAWVLLSPNLLMSALGGLYMLLLTVYGLVRSLSREPEKDMSSFTLIAAIGTMLLVYIIMFIRVHLEYEWSLMLQGFIFTIIYLWYDHETAVRDALKTMDKQGNMSTRRVIQFNGNVFNGYLAFGVILLVIAYAAGLGRVIGSVGNLLLMVIRKIVGFLTRDTEAPVIEEETTVVSDVIESNDMGGLPQGETSPFWAFLQHVLVVLFIGFLLYVIVVLLIRAFKNYHRSANYKEEGYEEYKTYYTKARPEKEARQRLSIFDRSPENMIRRAYYKKVRKQIDKKALRSDTPAEVAVKLPEVAEIVDNYEKVRYGKGLADE